MKGGEEEGGNEGRIEGVGKGWRSQAGGCNGGGCEERGVMLELC